MTQLLQYDGGLDPVNLFNYTRLVAAVTLTDRPKSICNRCVFEGFGEFLCCHFALLNYSVGVGLFAIGLSQISTLSSCKT